MPDLRLSLLGSFSVSIGGEPLKNFRTKAVRALLIYLACQAEEPHRREHLMTLLWPGLPQNSAQANLRQTVYLLRQAIPELQATDGQNKVPFLITSRQTVEINPEATFDLDVSTFESLLAGPTEDWPEAVALYRGDFLADFYLPDSSPFEEWVLARREALRRKVLDALSRLAGQALDSADYQTAENYARRQIGIDELRESAYRQLMTALDNRGHRTEALAAYDKLRQLLEKELGADPSAETVKLYEQILSGETEQLPQAKAAEIPVPDSRAVALPAFLQEADEKERDRPVFVGREEELARLHEVFEQALEGNGRILFVTGDAGSGKSSLMNSFAQEASERQADLLVAWGFCSSFTGQGDPYLPFRHLLATLTGDVEIRQAAGTLTLAQSRQLWRAMPVATSILLEDGPDLLNTFVPGPALISRLSKALPPNDRVVFYSQQQQEKEQALPGEMEQLQLFEQVTTFLHKLSERQPILLLLDDLQWADQGSLNLLFQLSRGLAGSRMLILGAYRAEEVALGRDGRRHPLEKITAEIQRSYGHVNLELSEMEAVKKRAFIDALLDSEPNDLSDLFREELFSLTGGHPLFTVETLRYLQEQGDVVLDPKRGWVEVAEVSWQQLPDKVEGIIAERLDRLDEDLREVLSIAAVEGQQFTVQVLAQVQSTPERQLLRILSRDLEKRHRLVSEQESLQLNGQFLSHYRFSHVLIQQYLYAEIGEAERRLLHGEIASILEELYRDHLDGLAVVLAFHYLEAGADEKALPYLQLAGDEARALYASQEAIDYYNLALGILKERSEFDKAARLLMKLGLTHHNAFQFEEARKAYDEGFELWKRAGSGEYIGVQQTVSETLHLGRSEPLSIDPSVIPDLNSHSYIEQLFSGLVEINPEMDVIPGVAYSWQVLDGGRRYIFKLRDDVFWSDGVQVTAADFEFAWIRMLNPALRYSEANYYYAISGAKAYHQGESTDANTIGIRIINDLMLEVQLEQPVSYFLQILPLPLPRHVVQRHGPSWTDLDKIVTNGPFQLASWVPGESIVLKRNPSYHGHFFGNVETVVLHQLAGPGKAKKLYFTNELDILDLASLNTAEFNQLRQMYASEYFSQPVLRTFYLCFDNRRPPFDDPRVRQAFALSIDKDKLADLVFGGKVYPATGGLVPPGMPGHSEKIALPFDPAEGRQILRECGYPNGEAFPVFELLLPPYVSEDFAQYVRDQILENLGIEVVITPLSIFALRERLDSRKIHLWLNGFQADFPDPDNLLRTSGIYQDIGAGNEDFERLIDEAQRIKDQGQRIERYKQAERIIIDQALLLPLFYGREHYLMKPWVRSYPSSGLKNWYWKDVVIDPHGA